jgi:GNAT superfamily N-acetyltransferase
MAVEMEPAFAYREEIGQLFREYTDMLVEGDPKFKEYLDIQNYDEELLHLEHKYGPPEGRLYIVHVDGEAAGCIGLRRIDEENCELKRLYVRPAFRGHGLSRLLMDRILSDARSIGYRTMMLDTLPFLQPALKLYQAYGFEEIERYNDSPMDTSIYMKLALQA